MSKTAAIPFTWKQIEDDLRHAIYAQADVTSQAGPQEYYDEFLSKFLGIPLDLILENPADAFINDFDIERHRITKVSRIAYNYAYQLDGWREADISTWDEVHGYLEGYARSPMDGNVTAFSELNELPLRLMLMTFRARYGLYNEQLNMEPNVVELSLMANMTVPAVRTSLSKEGFTLSSPSDPKDSGRYTLDTESAMVWLSRRRGFIPQSSLSQEEGLHEQAVAQINNSALDFNVGLSRGLDILKVDTATLASAAEVSPEWLQKLLAGDNVVIDVDALVRLARHIGVSGPSFASAGVKYLIEKQL